MQRSTLLISISLAAVMAGLFFVNVRMNPSTRSQSVSTSTSVQTKLAPSILESATGLVPATREKPAPRRSTPSPTNISVSSAAKPKTESLSNTGDPQNIQAATQARGNDKRFNHSPQPSGNVPQRASVEEATELPPIVVPLDFHNPNSPATLPAVLIESLPSENFTPQQLAGINKLTEDFIKTVTDPTISQEPNNPEYQQRWRSAQVTADDLFRIHYGDYAWMQRHNAAHREILLKGGK